MNSILLLSMSEITIQIIFGVITIINILLIFKKVYP